MAMPDFAEFAATDNEARARADLYRQVDPFPEVKQALLSSAEITDYVRETAMLFPFYPDALKSASYQANIGGQLVYWNEDKNRVNGTIERGTPCVVPKNSITFVQVEPTFRLPHYIALRFNLRITHVHRGLLLGTGPLVDPGFEGKLWVPLHNLTDEDYQIDTTKALIWIEFTKTTFNARRAEWSCTRRGEFVPFPESKKNKDPDYYISRASGGNPIRSSIGGALQKTSRDAQEAKDSAKKAKRTIRTFGIFAALALVVTLAGLTYQILSLVQDASMFVHSVSERITELETRNSALSEAVTRLETRIESTSGSRHELNQNSTNGAEVPNDAPTDTDIEEP